MSSKISSKLEYYVIKVGAANFTMFKSNKKLFIVDCGYRKGNWIVKRKISNKKLKFINSIVEDVKEILILISHNEQDHNRLISLLKHELFKKKRIGKLIIIQYENNNIKIQKMHDDKEYIYEEKCILENEKQKAKQLKVKENRDIEKKDENQKINNILKNNKKKENNDLENSERCTVENKKQKEKNLNVNKINEDKNLGNEECNVESKNKNQEANNLNDNKINENKEKCTLEIKNENIKSILNEIEHYFENCNIYIFFPVILNKININKNDLSIVLKLNIKVKDKEYGFLVTGDASDRSLVAIEKERIIIWGNENYLLEGIKNLFKNIICYVVPHHGSFINKENLWTEKVMKLSEYIVLTIISSNPSFNYNIPTINSLKEIIRLNKINLNKNEDKLYYCRPHIIDCYNEKIKISNNKYVNKRKHSEDENLKSNSNKNFNII